MEKKDNEWKQISSLIQKEKDEALPWFHYHEGIIKRADQAVPEKKRSRFFWRKLPLAWQLSTATLFLAFVCTLIWFIHIKKQHVPPPDTRIQNFADMPLFQSIIGENDIEEVSMDRTSPLFALLEPMSRTPRLIAPDHKKIGVTDDDTVERGSSKTVKNKIQAVIDRRVLEQMIVRYSKKFKEVQR